MAGAPEPDKAELSPAAVRARGNHLRGQSSLYLRQHDHNPVDWHPWGEAALRRAREESRPIFLSIGYSSCHWCHVMEKETFEDDGVAEALNQNFVSIKVDREERPDLDAAYLDAVQTLTGTGGWPLSVFLTPERLPFFGGTYFPRERFLDALRRIAGLWRQDPGRIRRQADALHGVLSAEVRLAPSRPLELDEIRDAAGAALSLLDEEWGGLRGRMKFPNVPLWQFLLDVHRATGEEALARAVRKTLDAMASGGIRDHLDGGFHRYSVDPAWVVPHFEKMLYDNALLARLYTLAAERFSDALYPAVARETLDFMIREMRVPPGCFLASIDADSGGVEGAYYLWNVEQIKEAAGPEDGEALAKALGVTERGHIDGQSVLTSRGSLPAGELLERHRSKLLAARSARVRPLSDRKVIAAWNGLAIAALAEGHRVFGERRWLDAAQEAADVLWEPHRLPDGRLLRIGHDGRAEQDGFLDDYAFLADGLLALHAAGGRAEALDRAVELLDRARTWFVQDGRAYLTAPGQEAPLGRREDLFDHAMPSGSAVLVRAMIEASRVAGRDDFFQDAQKVLDLHADIIRQAGLEMSWWLDAALLAIQSEGRLDPQGGR